MTTGDFIDGLKLLEPYCDRTDYSVSSVHDEFGIKTTKELPVDTKAELNRLGWDEDEDASGWWRAFT